MKNSSLETNCFTCFFLFGMTGKHGNELTGYCRRYPKAERIGNTKSYVCGEWRHRELFVNLNDVITRMKKDD